MKISLFHLKKIIPQGELFPKWYGVAYHDMFQLSYVAYPIPLNLIVRWARNVKFWLGVPRKSFRSELEKTFHDLGYERGYRRGWDAAKENSKQQVNDLLTAIVMGAMEKKDEAERN